MPLRSIKGETVLIVGNTKVVYGEMATTGVALADFPGSLSLWLDPTDTDSFVTTASGVSNWYDKSGLNNHFGQTTTSKQPPMLAGGINNKNSLSFNGTSQYLSVGTGLFQTSQSGDFWAVCVGPDVTNPHILFAQTNASGAAPFNVLFFSRSGSRQGTNNSAASTVCDFNLLPSNNVNHVMRWTCSGTKYGSAIDGTLSNMYTGGGAVGIDNGNWYGDITTASWIGSGSVITSIGAMKYNFAEQQFFNGKLGEILYFDDDLLNPEQIKSLNLYLGRKWGIIIS